MNKKLLELEERLDKKKTELRNVQDRINRVKEKEVLPEFKRMYVGKCFRYMNSGGGKSWPVYFKVLDIADVICVGENYTSVRAKCFSFELYPDDYEKDASIFRIFHTYNFPTDLLGTEISLEEFDKAWAKSLEKIVDIYQ